jgi:hypothetical protein
LNSDAFVFKRKDRRLVSQKCALPSTSDTLENPAKLTTNESLKLLPMPSLEAQDLEVAVQSLHYRSSSDKASGQTTIPEQAGFQTETTMQAYAVVLRPPAQNLLSLVRQNRRLKISPQI